jgi:hypothetical protein
VEGRRSTARGQVLLVVRPHWVLPGSVRIMSVLHSDVAITVATLASDDRRAGVALRLLLVLRCQATLILVVFESDRRLCLRLGLGLLAIVVVSRCRLTSTIVSAGVARRVRVSLPLIHGGGGRKATMPQL